MIKFTSQDGNLVAGTETSGTAADGCIVVHSYSMGSITGFSLLSVNENGYSYATVSISSDGERMSMTVNSFADSGERSVEIVIFEKL